MFLYGLKLLWYTGPARLYQMCIYSDLSFLLASIIITKYCNPLINVLLELFY